jgi:hypothetical protein
VFEDFSDPACNIITSSGSPAASQNDTITAQELADGTYNWSVSSTPGWSIVSGQNTPELIYTAGAHGTSATISLEVIDNENSCNSTCNITLTADSTTKSAFIMEGLSSQHETLIEVYPNPFTDQAQVAFTPAESGPGKVEIYSISGVFRGTLFDAEVSGSNRYEVMVDGAEMLTGTYYCVIRINDKVYTRKLMLVR